VAQVRAVWLPLGVILLAYAVASAVNAPLRANLSQGAPNVLGFPLHIGEPVVADEWLFGSLPTNWLAQRLHGSAGPQWYDAVAAILYISHFLVIPGVAVALWTASRARFRSWIWCVCLLVAIGTTVYIVYPMAPPWMAGDLGRVERGHPGLHGRALRPGRLPGGVARGDRVVAGGQTKTRPQTGTLI
jgi:hypothetical protein